MRVCLECEDVFDGEEELGQAFVCNRCADRLFGDAAEIERELDEEEAGVTFDEGGEA